MFVDACIAKDGEFGPLCYLHPVVIFLNWWIIFFDSKLVFCYPSVWVYLFPMDKTWNECTSRFSRQNSRYAELFQIL
jgi:hypothetical protein